MNTEPKYDAFISYRRDGGSETVRLIQASLEAKGKKVFLDVDELKTGKFDEKLLHTIRDTPNFILILNPGSLDRCKNEDDFFAISLILKIYWHFDDFDYVSWSYTIIGLYFIVVRFTL